MINLCWCNKRNSTEITQFHFDNWIAVINYIKENVVISSRKEGAHLFNLCGIKKINDEGVILNEYGYPRRKQDNVLSVSGLCLDLDEGDVKVDWIRQEFAHWNYLLYTSFNHLNPEKGSKESYRLILPFKTAVFYNKDYQLSDYSKRIEVLKKQWEPYAGKASFTIPQAAYFPSYPQERADKAIWEINEGEFFDFMEIPEQIKEKRGPYKEKVKITTMAIGNNEQIILADGLSMTLTELYNLLPAAIGNAAAYANKQSCFAIDRNDSNPGCFIFRIGNGLSYIDNLTMKARYIPIVEEIKGLPKLSKRKSKATEIVNIKVPIKQRFDDNFYVESKATLEECRTKLKEWCKDLASRNIWQTNEGFGKSYAVMFLLQMGKKIIFASVSNKQAKEKYDDICKWVGSKEHKGDNWIWMGDKKILHLYSRSGLFTLNTGYRTIRKGKEWNPFDETGMVDKQATIKAILDEHPELVSIINDEWWKENYEDLDVPNTGEIFNSDVVVTTFARADILAKAYNKNLDDSWVIIYDDPTIKEIQRLYFITDKMKKYVFDYKADMRFNPTKEPLVEPEIFKIKLSENQGKDKTLFYVKPIDSCLGNNFKPHNFTDEEDIDSWVVNPVIYNTTENILTEMIMAQQLSKTKLQHDLRKLNAPNLHMWATSIVFKKNHEQIEPIIKQINQSFGMDIEYIANGVGTSLNHTTALGNNQLKDKNLVIKISNIPPFTVNKIYAELSYMLNVQKSPVISFTGIERDRVEVWMLTDVLNQLAGRNQGMRDKGALMIMLITPTLFNRILDKGQDVRYNPGIKVFIDKIQDDKSRQELIEYYESNIPWVAQLLKWIRDPE